MTARELGPFFTDPGGHEHSLSSQVTTIGRAVQCDIVITSKRVSREHARVTRDGWKVMLEDLDSTNGTFLNGERVLGPVDLQDEDRVMIGDVNLVFHDPDVTFRETPFPELEVDAAAGIVRVNRQAITLSPKEFSLLLFVHENAGQVCSKDMIGQAVWPEYEGEVYDYQVENLVRRLRAKFEPDPTHPQLLLTIRGLGYKLVTPH